MTENFSEKWEVGYHEKFQFSIKLHEVPTVSCFRNCSDSLWEIIVPVMDKKVMQIRENDKVLRTLEQFIHTLKGQNKYWNKWMAIGANHWDVESYRENL